MRLKSGGCSTTVRITNNDDGAAWQPQWRRQQQRPRPFFLLLCFICFVCCPRVLLVYTSFTYTHDTWPTTTRNIYNKWIVVLNISIDRYYIQYMYLCAYIYMYEYVWPLRWEIRKLAVDCPQHTGLSVACLVPVKVFSVIYCSSNGNMSCLSFVPYVPYADDPFCWRKKKFNFRVYILNNPK